MESGAILRREEVMDLVVTNRPESSNDLVGPRKKEEK